MLAPPGRDLRCWFACSVWITLCFGCSKPELVTPAATPPARTESSSAVIDVEPVDSRAAPPASVAAPPDPEPAPGMGRFTVLSGAALDLPDSATPCCEAALPAGSVTDHSRWRLQRTIRVGKSHLSQAGVSRDGSEVWGASEADGVLRVYDVATGRALRTWRAPDYEAFGQGPNGSFELVEWTDPKLSRFLYASPRGLVRVSLGDAPAREQLLEGWVNALRWSEDGAILGFASAHNDGSRLALSRVKDQTLGEPLVLDAPGRLEDWALSSDRSLLATLWFDLHPPGSERAAASRDVVELYDLSSRALVWQAVAPRYANAVDLSPDGRFVAVVGAEVDVLDTSNGARLGRFTQLGNNAHAVRFHPSGDALAVSAYDGHVRILGIPQPSDTLPLLRDLRHAGTANVYVIRFFDAGTKLLSSSGDQTLRIWALGK